MATQNSLNNKSGTFTTTTTLASGTTLTGGTGITATTGNIVASTGNITSTLGSLSAATTVTGGTGVTATTGNVVATAGQVNAGTSMTAATALTVSAFGRGMVRSSSAGAFSSINGTDGQVLIAATGSDPAWASLTAGTNITLTPGANSLTIAASGGGTGFTWNNITGAGGGTTNMAVNNGYIDNTTLSQNFLLPATAAVGAVVAVAAPDGAGIPTITQNALQSITFTDTGGNSSQTTIGTGGSLSFGGGAGGTAAAVQLLCVTANTTFIVSFYTGLPNIT